MDNSDAQVLDDLSISRVLSSVLMWSVVYLKEAEQERLVLPKVERNALIHAVEKLEAFGAAARVSAYERGPRCCCAAGVAAWSGPKSMAGSLPAGW